jgi:hypothetical protein
MNCGYPVRAKQKYLGVRVRFAKYIAKPKRTGQPRKDPGFRWFDEPNSMDADRTHLNNWQPIIEVLEDLK